MKKLLLTTVIVIASATTFAKSLQCTLTKDDKVIETIERQVEGLPSRLSFERIQNVYFSVSYGIINSGAIFLSLDILEASSNDINSARAFGTVYSNSFETQYIQGMTDFVIACETN